jgi:hypothetical protein
MRAAVGSGTGKSQDINNGGTTMKTKTPEEIRKVKYYLAANAKCLLTKISTIGREGLLNTMSSGEWECLLLQRVVCINATNMDEVRRRCEDLSDGELAEYMAFLSAALCEGFLEAKGAAFFEAPGTSAFTVTLNVRPLSEYRKGLSSILRHGVWTGLKEPKTIILGDSQTVVTRTVGECRKLVIEEMRRRSVVMSGWAANHVDLGKVGACCSEFRAGVFGEGEAITAEICRIREKLMGIKMEMLSKAMQLCPPAEKSICVFTLAECSDGCVGVIINVPSPLSELCSHYQPIMCTCNGVLEGIEL